MFRLIRRIIIYTLLAVLAAGLVAPYLSADYFHHRIREALERGFGRKVEVGAVHYNLLTGPGFTVEGVTISDDPSMGIEPMAYIGSMEARVRLTSLWSGQLEFSSLRLSDDITINLVKPESGPWNFQLLLQQTEGKRYRLPAIHMRGGRINFKFGDTKSVFFFSDADLDVEPGDGGEVEVQFTGGPARTDRAAQNFGQLSARGTVRMPAQGDSELNLYVELEQSAISEVVRLLDGRGIGVHGVVAATARVRGPASNLQVEGDVHLGDIHRWDLLPSGGSAVRLTYRGTLDLHGEKLDLQTYGEDNKPQPVSVRFRAADYLATPRWGASLELRELPVSTFLEVARHMGVPLPDKGSVDGKLSGLIGYSSPGGLEGQLKISDSAVTLPDSLPVRLPEANVLIDSSHVELEPSTVDLGTEQSAQVEGSYSFAASGGYVKIATKGLSVAELQSGSGRLLGAASVPLLERIRQGTWKGWIRYQKDGDAAGAWSGAYELRNAQIEVDGLAAPVRLAGASVSVNGDSVAVEHLKAKAGPLAFEGEYRYEPGAVRPHKLKLTIAEADVKALEKLLMPALVRRQGFLARTLRIGKVVLPDWLKTRGVDARISIGSLTAADSRWKIASARLLWDGPIVRLVGIRAELADARASGDLEVDLSGRVPRYRLDGKVVDLPYKDGDITLDGNLTSSGTGISVLANAKADGMFRASDIQFNPDAAFDRIGGCFELVMTGGAPHWKLSTVEATQGSDVYYGQGSSGSDGRLVLDLASGKKQLRYTGTVLALAPSGQ